MLTEFSCQCRMTANMQAGSLCYCCLMQRIRNMHKPWIQLMYIVLQALQLTWCCCRFLIFVSEHHTAVQQEALTCTALRQPLHVQLCWDLMQPFAHNAAEDDAWQTIADQWVDIMHMHLPMLQCIRLGLYTHLPWQAVFAGALHHKETVSIGPS